MKLSLLEELKAVGLINTYFIQYTSDTGLCEYIHNGLCEYIHNSLCEYTHTGLCEYIAILKHALSEFLVV